MVSTRENRNCRRNMRLRALTAMLALGVSVASAQPAADRICGEVVTLDSHDRTTTRYALALPKEGAPTPRAALVLMVGGGGDLKMDERGCARALEGNPLVRAMPQFLDNGLVTVLVDTPSDHPGEDGLAGFRMAPAHAEDLGKLIEDVRARVKAPVWLAGHSRGTVSVANAAARLSGAPMMVGGGKSYAAQTVFNAALERVRMPVLVMGHADDNCVRSPAAQMERVTARTNGAREQVAVLTGGSPPVGGSPSLEACGARQPHGFFNLDAAFAAGVARFVRGGEY
jgi:pimeloyl-ACP methyl ester carboxylesterase